MRLAVAQRRSYTHTHDLPPPAHGPAPEAPMPLPPAPGHAAHHCLGTSANPLRPPATDLLRVGSRRWFLQTGLAGLAGLTLADTLRLRAAGSRRDPRAVILFWLSGGPSQID